MKGKKKTRGRPKGSSRKPSWSSSPSPPPSPKSPSPTPSASPPPPPPHPAASRPSPSQATHRYSLRKLQPPTHAQPRSQPQQDDAKIRGKGPRGVKQMPKNAAEGTSKTSATDSRNYGNPKANTLAPAAGSSISSLSSHKKGAPSSGEATDLPLKKRKLMISDNAPSKSGTSAAGHGT